MEGCVKRGDLHRAAAGSRRFSFRFVGRAKGRWLDRLPGEISMSYLEHSDGVVRLFLYFMMRFGRWGRGLCTWTCRLLFFPSGCFESWALGVAAVCELGDCGNASTSCASGRHRVAIALPLHPRCRLDALSMQDL